MEYIPAGTLRVKYPVKPLINSEPCYEGRRLQPEKVRRIPPGRDPEAAWTSVLSGASAGVTYGAHGVWNWKKKNSPCNRLWGRVSIPPFRWRKALCLPPAAAD
jgi:hypothetical protein